MEREGCESAEEWYTRALRNFQAARAEEDRQWLRLRAGEPAGGQPALDNAYMDAVEHADQADLEMIKAARAVDHEQAI